MLTRYINTLFVLQELVWAPLIVFLLFLLITFSRINSFAYGTQFNLLTSFLRTLTIDPLEAHDVI